MYPEAFLNRVIAHYRLEEIIGVGGMGGVYLSRSIDNADEVVAIKLLMPPLNTTLQDRTMFRERFIREAQTLERLHHAHILPMISFGEEDGVAYLLLPYLGGGTLKTKIESGPLPMPLILSFLTQMAEALDYAHQQGVIHRDIKPSNILLDDQGNLYLSDFSIARLFESNQSTLTGTGNILGTLGYMSPEQASGQLATPASDLYSLGVVLYEMVTGRPLFQVRTTNGGKIPSPRDLRPDLTEAAAMVIMQMLSLEPEQRLASGSILVSAFIQGLAQNGQTFAPSAPLKNQGSTPLPKTPTSFPTWNQPSPSETLQSPPANKFSTSSTPAPSVTPPPADTSPPYKFGEQPSTIQNGRRGPTTRSISAVVGIFVVVVLLAVFLLRLPHGTGSHGTGTSVGQTSTSYFTYQYATPTHTGGTVVFGDWQSPDTTNLLINAQLINTVTDASLDSALYDGCYFQLPDLTLKADSWKVSQCKSVDEAADGMTTTLHLDPQAKWSDGTPITSKDYRLWYDMYADPNLVGGTLVTPYNKAALAFPDDNTVTINWHQPFGPWRINLPSAMPSQQYKDSFDPTKYIVGTELSASLADPGYNSDVAQADLGMTGSNANTVADTTKSITNGPYVVQDFGDGTTITMAPNPYYYSNYFHKPTLTKLIDKTSTNKNALIQAYINGQYDHAEDFTLADKLQFGGIPAKEVVTSPAVSFEHLEFNERPQAPNAAGSTNKTSIFADANVRKAFIEAFDRNAAIQAILGVDPNDPAIKTNEFTAPPDPAYDPSAPIAGYNLMDANQLLDAAGYKKAPTGLRTYPGTTTPVSIAVDTTTNNPVRESFVELIKQQVGLNLGITVTTNLIKSNKFFGTFASGGTLATGAYDVALFAYSTFAEGDQITANFDPADIPSATQLSGQNYMGINDPKILQYLQTGRTTIDYNTREQTYKDMYDYIAQQSYVYPLYIRADITLTKTTLGNYKQQATQEGNMWNVSDWFTTGTS